MLEELKDIAATLAEDGELIETNPERLQKVDDRLNTLYSLCQKHRAADEGELIALRDRYAAQLDAITHSDEELAALQTEIGAARNEAELLASELHRTREQAAPVFAGQIVATLVRLGMPDARFEAAVVDCGALMEGGRDRVEFRFSANRTTPPAAVERIASGGELSRVMLALKALLARRMRLLEMGDDTACALGVPVERSRMWLMLIGVVLTAASTALVGPISFVALLAPQIARRLGGGVKGALPLAALCGALLLIAADFAAQHLFLPYQLPVGVITVILGGLYLIALLVREARRQ